MMTGLNIARIAMLIALLGFVLPWVLVSCAGEPVGRLSGVDLATGGALQSRHDDPNLWVALSLAAVVVGIVASLLRAGRGAIVALAVAAVVALIASAIGVANVSSKMLGGPERSQPSGAVGGVDLQYGYVITVAGLLAAIGACGAALGGRERSPP